MKKVIVSVLFLGLLNCMVSCLQKETGSAVLSRQMISETICLYNQTDDEYRLYGYFKEVFRKYNYSYKDSSLHTVSYSDSTWVNAWLNEYGDTVRIIYIDITDYPKREE